LLSLYEEKGEILEEMLPKILITIRYEEGNLGIKICYGLILLMRSWDRYNWYQSMV